MLVYTPEITPRIQYIFDFIGKELLQEGFFLTSDRQTFINDTNPAINYSDERIRTDEWFLKATPLLSETGIQQQDVSCSEQPGFKTFFPTKGDLPFDIFAAAFYLLSRYEEYLPHEKDMYGRYAHQNSLAFREGFLNVPLVNTWLDFFKTSLKNRFPSLVFKSTSFLFLPTYDIDIAWSFKHKGWRRQLGGFARLFLTGKWSDIGNRLSVLRGKTKDPFDAYGWMNQLHEKYKLKPYYFFLLATRPGKYDKNISPFNTAMKNLVSEHVIRYPVGIHPSWQSGEDHHELNKEIGLLADLTGNKILSSRQHYIRFTLPETFRRLIGSGVGFDFSMGYGSINGFRASVATPFYWYDLEKELQTSLLLFPFCFMEANSFYEQHDSPQQALAEMKHYYKVVKEVNGTFIMIWHNSFLGTDELYRGWRDVYAEFMRINAGQK
ncbi:polysaccharide deacetylase family protein [Terrimonas sp. NA20]|uniref:Polysaccharide deacetylase family protein n=1 Tax=Terrimonas ginsenosidimutans TaxID=2908004 RepID=A0ABS9KQ80_9BACT|nr:polysaccharide deacetylase family protein [Terrimonas ginsenosidimutans]MCG2614430.1 polysaccharide deacetylase family protein [Terrimonas ginsenosidimutans]